MEAVKIVLLTICAAVLFGILHDQVTARVCVEYFTIGHRPVFQTDSPTLLGLGWGVIATWWVGLILGIPIACSARLGSRPPVRARDLRRPIGILLITMACLSLVAGVSGYFAAKAGVVWLREPLKSRVPTEKHLAFIADFWSHFTAYGSGFIGGIILCIWIWRGRLAPTVDTGT